jgi:uracil-DNA glycosylase family 4
MGRRRTRPPPDESAGIGRLVACQTGAMVPTRDTARAGGLTELTELAELAELTAEIVTCRRCPRLVAWRERVAAERVARFAGQDYWGRPVPGFGDPDARLLALGLAPAAHGGNRTGRVFTGDRSGDFLYAALHRAGLASQPTSVSRDDGLVLRGVYVAAALRCAPPANRPKGTELETCRPFVVRELTLLQRTRVILALGGIAWAAALRIVAALGHEPDRPAPRFAHGAEAAVGPYRLVGSYHPSQQNTFTGRLTPAMFDTVVGRAALLAGLDGSGDGSQAQP